MHTCVHTHTMQTHTCMHVHTQVHICTNENLFPFEALFFPDCDLQETTLTAGTVAHA